MKQTINIIKDQLKSHKLNLQKDFKVKKIGIFGSVISGKDTPRSDIDILVAFSESPGFFKFVKLENHLTKLLKRKVDLVTEQALKETVKAEILRQTLYV